MSELGKIMFEAHKEAMAQARRERIARMPWWRKIIDSDAWPTSVLVAWVSAVSIVTLIDFLTGNIGAWFFASGFVVASDGDRIIRRFE